MWSPRAALQPVPVRDQRRPRRLHRRDLQRQVAGRHQRLAAGQAGPAQHAAHRQQRPVGRHPVAVGTGEAEVGDGQHDQARVPCADDVGVQLRAPAAVSIQMSAPSSRRSSRSRPSAVVWSTTTPRLPALWVANGRLTPSCSGACVARRGAARRLDPDDVRPEVCEAGARTSRPCHQPCRSLAHRRVGSGDAQTRHHLPEHELRGLAQPLWRTGPTSSEVTLDSRQASRSWRILSAGPMSASCSTSLVGTAAAASSFLPSM